MCDFNKISNLLIALEICFGAAIVSIAVAATLAAIPLLGQILLIAAPLLVVASIVLSRFIRGEVEKCRGSSCANQYVDVLIESMNNLTWGLSAFALGLVAIILSVGALALWISALFALIAAAQITSRAALLSDFNACEVQAGNGRYIDKLSVAVGIGIALIVLVVAITIAGAVSGKLPVPNKWDWLRAILG